MDTDSIIRFRKIKKSHCHLRCLSVCLSVRLSVRMEKVGSRWTDFHQILCLSIFRKYVQKIQVSLKSDYITCRTKYLYINIQLDSSQNVKCFRQNLQGNKVNILCSITFSIKSTVYEVMWKNATVSKAKDDNTMEGRMDFAC